MLRLAEERRLRLSTGRARARRPATVVPCAVFEQERIHTHTCPHARTHTHACTCARLLPRTLSVSLSLSHRARARAHPCAVFEQERTHTHTRAHARTHTRACTCARLLPRTLSVSLSSRPRTRPRCTPLVSVRAPTHGRARSPRSVCACTDARTRAHGSHAVFFGGGTATPKSTLRRYESSTIGFTEKEIPPLPP